jgi:hypothetical protein
MAKHPHETEPVASEAFAHEGEPLTQPKPGEPHEIQPGERERDYELTDISMRPTPPFKLWQNEHGAWGYARAAFGPNAASEIVPNYLPLWVKTEEQAKEAVSRLWPGAEFEMGEDPEKDAKAQAKAAREAEPKANPPVA